MEIVGFGSTLKTVATDIHIFQKSVTEAKAGDHVGVLCRGVKLVDIRRGMALCAPQSLEQKNYFKVSELFPLFLLLLKIVFFSQKSICYRKSKMVAVLELKADSHRKCSVVPGTSLVEFCCQKEQNC